jgi:hypothetical protein
LLLHGHSISIFNALLVALSNHNVKINPSYFDILVDLAQNVSKFPIQVNGFQKGSQI